MKFRPKTHHIILGFLCLLAWVLAITLTYENKETYARSNNQDFLDPSFWSLSPSDPDIIDALYGDGITSTAYTHHWNSNSCDIPSMTVEYIAPWHNTLPGIMNQTGTIYVLDTWTYTIDNDPLSNTPQIGIGADCIAIVWRDNSILNWINIELAYTSSYSWNINNIIFDSFTIQAPSKNAIQAIGIQDITLHNLEVNILWPHNWISWFGWSHILIENSRFFTWQSGIVWSLWWDIIVRNNILQWIQQISIWLIWIRENNAVEQNTIRWSQIGIIVQQGSWYDINNNILEQNFVGIYTNWIQLDSTEQEFYSGTNITGWVYNITMNNNNIATWSIGITIAWIGKNITAENTTIQDIEWLWIMLWDISQYTGGTWADANDIENISFSWTSITNVSQNTNFIPAWAIAIQAGTWLWSSIQDITFTNTNIIDSIWSRIYAWADDNKARVSNVTFDWLYLTWLNLDFWLLAMQVNNLGLYNVQIDFIGYADETVTQELESIMPIAAIGITKAENTVLENIYINNAKRDGLVLLDTANTTWTNIESRYNGNWSQGFGIKIAKTANSYFSWLYTNNNQQIGLYYANDGLWYIWWVEWSTPFTLATCSNLDFNHIHSEFNNDIGIKVWTWSSSPCGSNTFSHVQINDNQEYGLRLFSDKSLFSDMQIFNNPTGIRIHSKWWGVTIEYSQIYNNEVGIETNFQMWSANNMINNSLIFNNTQVWVYLSGSNDWIVTNNSVIFNNPIGIRAWAQKQNTLFNNTLIFNNNIGYESILWATNIKFNESSIYNNTVWLDINTDDAVQYNGLELFANDTHILWSDGNDTVMYPGAFNLRSSPKPTIVSNLSGSAKMNCNWYILPQNNSNILLNDYPLCNIRGHIMGRTPTNNVRYTFFENIPLQQDNYRNTTAPNSPTTIAGAYTNMHIGDFSYQWYEVFGWDIIVSDEGTATIWTNTDDITTRDNIWPFEITATNTTNANLASYWAWDPLYEWNVTLSTNYTVWPQTEWISRALNPSSSIHIDRFAFSDNMYTSNYYGIMREVVQATTCNAISIEKTRPWWNRDIGQEIPFTITYTNNSASARSGTFFVVDVLSDISYFSTSSVPFTAVQTNRDWSWKTWYLFTITENLNPWETGSIDILLIATDVWQQINTGQLWEELPGTTAGIMCMDSTVAYSARLPIVPPMCEIVIEPSFEINDFELIPNPNDTWGAIVLWNITLQSTSTSIYPITNYQWTLSSTGAFNWSPYTFDNSMISGQWTPTIQIDFSAFSGVWWDWPLPIINLTVTAWLYTAEYETYLRRDHDSWWVYRIQWDEITNSSANGFDLSIVWNMRGQRVYQSVIWNFYQHLGPSWYFSGVIGIDRENDWINEQVFIYNGFPYGFTNTYTTGTHTINLSTNFGSTGSYMEFAQRTYPVTCGEQICGDGIINWIEECDGEPWCDPVHCRRTMPICNDNVIFSVNPTISTAIPFAVTWSIDILNPNLIATNINRWDGNSTITIPGITAYNHTYTSFWNYRAEVTFENIWNDDISQTCLQLVRIDEPVARWECWTTILQNYYTWDNIDTDNLCSIWTPTWLVFNELDAERSWTCEWTNWWGDTVCSLTVWYCSDGIINWPEQCDDSNLNDWDWCSSSCMVEPGSCSLTAIPSQGIVPFTGTLIWTGTPGYTFQYFDYGSGSTGTVNNFIYNDTGVYTITGYESYTNASGDVFWSTCSTTVQANECWTTWSISYDDLILTVTKETQSDLDVFPNGMIPYYITVRNDSPLAIIENVTIIDVISDNMEVGSYFFTYNSVLYSQLIGSWTFTIDNSIVPGWITLNTGEELEIIVRTNILDDRDPADNYIFAWGDWVAPGWEEFCTNDGEPEPVCSWNNNSGPNSAPQSWNNFQLVNSFDPTQFTVCADNNGDASTQLATCDPDEWNCLLDPDIEISKELIDSLGNLTNTAFVGDPTTFIVTIDFTNLFPHTFNWNNFSLTDYLTGDIFGINWFTISNIISSWQTVPFTNWWNEYLIDLEPLYQTSSYTPACETFNRTPSDWTSLNPTMFNFLSSTNGWPNLNYQAGLPIQATNSWYIFMKRYEINDPLLTGTTFYPWQNDQWFNGNSVMEFFQTASHTVRLCQSAWGSTTINEFETIELEITGTFTDASFIEEDNVCNEVNLQYSTNQTWRNLIDNTCFDLMCPSGYSYNQNSWTCDIDTIACSLVAAPTTGETPLNVSFGFNQWWATTRWIDYWDGTTWQTLQYTYTDTGTYNPIAYILNPLDQQTIQACPWNLQIDVLPETQVQPFCGDGIINGNEECDLWWQNWQPNWCSQSCELEQFSCNIRAINTSGSLPLTVSFGYNRNPGEWYINYGDGTTGTSLTHIYTQTGSYTITWYAYHPWNPSVTVSCTLNETIHVQDGWNQNTCELPFSYSFDGDLNQYIGSNGVRNTNISYTWNQIFTWTYSVIYTVYTGDISMLSWQIFQDIVISDMTNTYSWYIVSWVAVQGLSWSTQTTTGVLYSGSFIPAVVYHGTWFSSGFEYTHTITGNVTATWSYIILAQVRENWWDWWAALCDYTIFTGDFIEPICGNNIKEPGEECDGWENCNNQCMIQEVEDETTSVWWGWGWWTTKDYCPDGDFSTSYYDGTCGVEEVHSSPEPIGKACRYDDEEYLANGPFTDTVNHRWYPYAEIMRISCMHRGRWIGQGLWIYEPNSNILRSEVLKTVVKILWVAFEDFDIETENIVYNWPTPFADVPKEHRFAHYANYAYEAWLTDSMITIQDGKLYINPDKDITRYEAIQLIMTAYNMINNINIQNIDNQWSSVLWDMIDANNPYYQYVRQAEMFGFISWVPQVDWSYNFEWQRYITRSELAKIVSVPFTEQLFNVDEVVLNSQLYKIVVQAINQTEGDKFVFINTLVEKLQGIDDYDFIMDFKIQKGLFLEKLEELLIKPLVEEAIMESS